MSGRLDVAVDGGRLAAYRLGAEADTVAPLVLAIHGITSTSRTWLATARAQQASITGTLAMAIP